MRCNIHGGPLTASMRECWVLTTNRRLSAETPGWTSEPTLHALVIESVRVEEAQRCQGQEARPVALACADERFDLVIVEGVQNPILAESLLRHGWECDPVVSDYYRLKQARTL